MRENQKGIILLPILIVVIFIGAVGYFVIQKSQLKTFPTTVTDTSALNLGDNQPEQAPILNPTSDSNTKWEVYKDEIAGFTLRYPDYWKYTIRDESEKMHPDANGNWGYSGKVEFVGNNGLIELTYGDGFGGAHCGASESYLEFGISESYQTKDQNLELCKFEPTEFTAPSNFEYNWANGFISNPNQESNDLTLYHFGVESDFVDLRQTEIPEILSTFEFTD